MFNSSILKPYQDEIDWDIYGRETYFLGHDPMRLGYVMGSYLAFVYLIGPILMQRRQAFELKGLVRLLNIINILNNLALLYYVFELTEHFSIYFNCKVVRKVPDQSYVFMEAYLWSRLFDLSDTILLILRKKYRQVTKLHVFHHTIVPTAIFAGCHISMSQFIGFGFIVNIIVHIFMYTYYTMASYPSMARYMGIKRYITRLQLAQFALNCLFYIVGYIAFSKCPNGVINKFNYTLMLTCNLIFLISFGNFYIAAYKKDKNKEAKSA